MPQAEPSTASSTEAVSRPRHCPAKRKIQRNALFFFVCSIVNSHHFLQAAKLGYAWLRFCNASVPQNQNSAADGLDKLIIVRDDEQIFSHADSSLASRYSASMMSVTYCAAS